jgi:hypothetical protein
MKKVLLPLFFSLCIVFRLTAADNYPVGSRSAGVANASVTYSDVWSSFHNQAGLAALKHPSAGVFFENKFLVSELSLKSFAVAVPTPKVGTFSLSATMFGGDLYNEKKIGVGYGKKLGEKFSAGVQLDYLSTYVAEDYGTRNSFAVEIGFIAEPIRNLKLGAHVFNPNKAKVAEYADERVPVIMRFGASYKFSEKILLSAEEEKDIDQQAVFKTGLEYHIVDVLYVRAGISSNPSLTSFGFGLKIKKLVMDVASSWHQELGFSPQLSLGYNFDN